MRSVSFLLVAVFCCVLAAYAETTHDDVLLKLTHYITAASEEFLDGNKINYEKIAQRLCENETITDDANFKECERFTEIIPYMVSFTMNNYKRKQLFSPLSSQQVVAQQMSVAESELCKVCNALVNMIRFDLKVMNMSSEKVKQAVEYLCDSLAPLEIQKKVCHDIMDQIDDVIQKILNGVTPGDICTELNLCSNSTITKTNLMTPNGYLVTNLFRPHVGSDINGLSQNHKQQHHPNIHRWHPHHSRHYRRSHHHRRHHRPSHHHHRRRRPSHHHGHHKSQSRPHSEVEGSGGEIENVKPTRHWVTRFLPSSLGNYINDLFPRNEQKQHHHSRRLHPHHRRHHRRSHRHRRHRHHHKYRPHPHPHPHHRNHTHQGNHTHHRNHTHEGNHTHHRNHTHHHHHHHHHHGLNFKETFVDVDENNDTNDTIIEEARPVVESVKDRIPLAKINVVDKEFTETETNDPNNEERDDLESESNLENKTPNIDDDYEKNIGDSISILNVPARDEPIKFFKDIDDTGDEITRNEEEQDINEQGLAKNVFGFIPFVGVKNLFKQPKQKPDFTHIREEAVADMMETFFEPPGFITEKFDEVIKNARAELEQISDGLKTKFGTVMAKATNDIGCTLCNVIVKFITWQVKTTNASIEFVEKAVRALCKLYPIKEATEVCNAIIDNLDKIVQMIEGGLEPGDICERMKLCNSTGLISTVTITTPTKSCSPLCSFMKTIYNEDMIKSVTRWTDAKSDLMTFCMQNNIITKCSKLVSVFEKAERRLSGAMVSPNGDIENCQCFPMQQAFHDDGSDVCKSCKQVEKGLIDELKEVNETMTLLALTLRELCTFFPEASQQCYSIVTKFENSFVHLENKLVGQDICKAIGFCKDIRTLNKADLRKTLKRLGGNLFLRRGTAMFHDIFTPACTFCKTCMENLKKRFNTTEMMNTKENMMPIMENELEIFCEKFSDGEETRHICKTIKNGIEQIEEGITKTNNGGEICKMLGICEIA